MASKPGIIAPRLLGSSRLSVTLMCSLNTFVALQMTMLLSMAIVCRSPRPAHFNETQLNATQLNETLTFTDDPLSYSNETSGDSSEQTESGQWDKGMQGVLLSASYIGTVAIQVPVGYLSDKYGRMKLQMLVGIFTMSTITLLSPLIIPLPIYYLIAVRVIIGAGSGLSISSIMNLMNNWSTAQDRGGLLALAYSGMAVSNMATYPIAGFLCEYAGWQWIFYSAGIGGFTWCLVALFLIYDTPLQHVRISVEETQYLLSEPKSETQSKRAVPWCKIFTSLPVWSVMITNFCVFAVGKGLMLNLPLYMKDVLEFSVTENGLFSALPALVGLVVRLTSGPVFDWIRARNTFSLTILRKIFNTVGTIIPAIAFFGVAQLSSDQKYLSIALITAAVAMVEVAIIGGYTYSTMDLAPNFIGILSGINNTIGLASGFIIPVIISLLTSDATTAQWSHVFNMFAGLLAFAGLIYALTGSSRRQSWG